jgi:hypothetical protein
MDDAENIPEWSPTEIAELKKYCEAGNQLSVIMQKLRRNKEDIENEIKDRGYIIKSNPKLKSEKSALMFPLNEGGIESLPDISELIIKLINDNLVRKQQNDEMLKVLIEIRDRMPEKTSKEHTLSPKKEYVRCPSCADLWLLQKVTDN